MRIYESAYAASLFCAHLLALVEDVRAAGIHFAQGHSIDTSLTLKNITSLHSDVSSSTTTANGRPAPEPPIELLHCATPKKWIHPAFQGTDCLGAIDYLFITELHSRAEELCEFRLVGAPKTKHIRQMMTPRKYTFGIPINPFRLVGAD